jgi:hypothetical protein
VVLFDWLGPSLINPTATLRLMITYKKLFVTKLADVDLMMHPILTVETQDQLMDRAVHASLN